MNPGVWNTVSFVWEKTKMTWSLNGKAFISASSGRGTQSGWFTTTPGAGAHAPFDQKFHLLINLAIGGGFTGNMPPDAAVATLQRPASLQVDFIRVYGRN
jgi:beta-glucanase (GH16 family)